ncbi:hypothetical protein TgHK011_006489 [Trichoderma gracile]|nr:hypothetical protein TgHK011_006489 [Trichoderma gracile]
MAQRRHRPSPALQLAALDVAILLVFASYIFVANCPIRAPVHVFSGQLQSGASSSRRFTAGQIPYQLLPMDKNSSHSTHCMFSEWHNRSKLKIKKRCELRSVFSSSSASHSDY